MWLLSLILLVLGLSCAYVKGEICCRRIGCFNTDEGPMSHLPEPKCPEDLKIKYLLYTRDNPETPHELTLDNVRQYFLGPGLVTFVVHGWMSDSEVSWMPELVEGLLEHDDMRLIVLDWKSGSKKIYYPKSAANTQTVGAAIAALAQEMHEVAFVDWEDMWCIGFSLGAHACGHAGMRSGGKFGRVTGLDPAGPKFSGRDITNGINPTVAKFVDIIHTDGAGLVSYYGLLEPRGHVDFYPNRGRDQPGCYFGRKKRDLQSEYDAINCVDFDGWIDHESCPYNPFVGCSHFRGVYYFIDSLKDNSCHVAKFKCSDPKNIPKSCEVTGDVVMGVRADENKYKSGMFYLETQKRSPYCKN